MDPSFSGSYRDVIDNMGLALAIYRAVDNGEDFIFVEVNSGVEEIEQVKRENLIGERVTEAFPGVEEFGLLDVFRRVHRTGIPERFPISMYTDNRITGWRDNYVYKLDTGEIVAVYRDETMRKMQEERIKYLVQVLLAIRNVNQLIITEKDRDVLLQRSCEVMVETKGYNGAWIGLTDSSGSVESVYGAGFDPVRFNEFKNIVGNIDLPSLTNIGQPGVHVIEDVSGSCVGCPLQADDIGSNVLYASLMHDDRLYGLMMASVPVGIVQQQELDLFEEVVGDISYALYGLEVEEERKEMEMDLVLVNLLNTAVNRGTGLQEILNKLAEETKKIFQGYGASVYLISDDRTHLALQNHYLPERVIGIIEKLIGGRIPSVKIPLEPGCLYQEVLEMGEPRLFNDAESIRRLIADCAGNMALRRIVPLVYEALGIGSVMMAPLVSEGVCWGLIDIAGKEHYGEQDIMRLGRIAAQVTGVIKHKQMDDSLLESEEKFRWFMESATDGFLMLDEALRVIEVNDSWLKLMRFKRGDVLGKHILELFPSWKETGRVEDYLKALDAGESVDFLVDDPVSVGATALFVSVFKAGKVIGLVIRDVSEQVKYQRRLEALHGHAAALSSAESMEEVADITQDSLDEFIGFHVGSLSLIEGDFLVRQYKWGADSTEPFTLPLSGPGVTVEAVNTGKTLNIGDVSGSPLYVDGFADLSTVSELAVPIIESGKVVALINLESEKRDAFSEDDQRLVETLASHIATALSRLDYLDQLKVSYDALEASKENWEELIATIPDPVLINNSTHWLYANQQAADLWGYKSPSDIIGQSVTLFFSEEDGKMLLQRAKLRFEGGDVPAKYEQITQRVDGSLVPVEINVKVISFDGEPAILSIHRDISERKRSEARLSALHSFALKLDTAESLEDVVETSFRILREVLGFEFSSFQLLEDEALVTIGTDGEFEPAMVLPLTGKGITTRAAREARTIHLGDTRVDPGFIQGSTESLSELAVPILVENHVLGVLNVESLQLDAFTVDDARLMEVLAQNVGSALFRLRAAEDKLELERQVLVQQIEVEQEQEMSKMKTRFMSTATHDLRTPLTSIQGYTDLIQMDEGNLSESQRQYFSVIQRNVQRLTKLTDDLLEQQRLEEGRITVTFEPVNVLELVEMVRSEFMPIIGAKRQSLEVNCVDVVVGMDRLRLMQVLVNLLSNASKFSPEGGVIVVDVVETDDGVKFSVSDQGVGIGEEDIGKLFKPFPGILVKGNVGGTGLGLSISRGIVELHGGRIWAESDGLGKGCTITFTVPMNHE